MSLDFAKEVMERNQDFKVGDVIIWKKSGELMTITKIDIDTKQVWYKTEDVEVDWFHIDNLRNGEIVSKELEGGKPIMKTIYEVIVVDRKTNEVLLQETVIATSESNATFLIGLNHADTLKKLVLDNLDFTMLSKGSYNEVTETKVVLEKQGK